MFAKDAAALRAIFFFSREVATVASFGAVQAQQTSFFQEEMLHFIQCDKMCVWRRVIAIYSAILSHQHSQLEGYQKREAA